MSRFPRPPGPRVPRAWRPPIRGVFPLLLLLLGAARAAAGTEARPQDTLSLPEARARAEASREPLAAKTVIVPTDEDRMLGNLADLLQRVAGVHVVRAGGFGDYVGVHIHGSSERQVDVYVDGVPQNPAADPGGLLGERDLCRVERIEIHKGLAPDHLPGSPMGGAVNIITRGDPEGRHAEGALGTGSFGTLKASGRAGLRSAAFGLEAQAVHNRSDGDFPYYDDDGTEFQPGRHPDGAPRSGAGDLVRKVRRNNAHGYSEAGGSLRMRPAPAWELRTRADLALLDKQVPSPFANLDSTVAVSAFRQSLRSSWQGNAARSVPGHHLALDLSATHREEDYTDTSAAGGAVGLGYDRDRDRYLDLFATLTDRTEAASGLSIATLVSCGLSGYRHADRVAGRIHPWILRYAGEGKLSPSYVRGRHAWQASLSASVRLEKTGAEAYALGGKRIPKEEWGRLSSLRLGYQYLPRDGVTLSLQGGSSYRMPTFGEKFGDRGLVLGNPALEPEEGVNAVAGAEFKVGRASAEFRGYASHGRGIITLVQNSQNVLLHANSGATRIVGAEAALAARPVPWSRSEAAFTAQRALNLDGGTAVDDYRLIPYRPLAQASLRQSLLRGGWTLTSSLWWQGRTHPNPSNSPSLFDSYSHASEWQGRADLRLSWRGRHLLAAAGIDNVFDQRNFDFFNLPLPGRGFSALVQAAL